jgi:hypothetical protein
MSTLEAELAMKEHFTKSDLLAAEEVLPCGYKKIIRHIR